MDVAIWEHCTLDYEVFRCGKIYYSKSIINTNFAYTFIQNCWFKNLFYVYIGIEIY
jgi:hypothetical protein